MSDEFVSTEIHARVQVVGGGTAAAGRLRSRGVRRGRELVGKALVAVAVELEGRKMGRVRLRHIPNASGANLLRFVIDCVEKGSLIHTDGWRGYEGLTTTGYRHRVSHTAGDEQVAAEQFAHVHLVASLLKRWLAATYQGKVSKTHLQRYLDEFAFRFNRRKSRYVGLPSTRRAVGLTQGVDLSRGYRQDVGRQLE